MRRGGGGKRQKRRKKDERMRSREMLLPGVRVFRPVDWHVENVLGYLTRAPCYCEIIYKSRDGK